MKNRLLKIIALLLCFSLIFEQSGFAQVAGQLDISGYLTTLRSSFIQDKFRPLHLRYLAYDTLNNNFKLLLDKGDQFKGLSPQGTVPELESATKELLNYFFVGIALPNDSFWVNLRPDSQDNIIDDYLAQTDVGKILLEADLQLKKDTASFTSPQTPEGKKYWDKLYQKAGELLGQENITIPTLVRPWIVPDEIIIRETKDNAYIYKATLKVMLEEDYLKGSSTYNFSDSRLKALNQYSSQLLKERIIPKLTKEINTSKRYAALRQAYYSLILAQWFKARFYGKGGLYSWLIDKRNLNGLTSQAPWSKTTYFKEYQKSFKVGEYNLKVPVSTPFGQTIRSYMSGGIGFAEIYTSQVASSAIAGERNLGPKRNTIPATSSGGTLEDLAARGVKLTKEASSPLTPSLPVSLVEEIGRLIDKGEIIEAFFRTGEAISRIQMEKKLLPAASGLNGQKAQELDEQLKGIVQIIRQRILHTKFPDLVLTATQHGLDLASSKDILLDLIAFDRNNRWKINTQKIIEIYRLLLNSGIKDVEILKDAVRAYELSPIGFEKALEVGVPFGHLEDVSKIFAVSLKLGELAIEKFKKGESIQEIFAKFAEALSIIGGRDFLRYHFGKGEAAVFVPARLERINGKDLLKKAIEKGIIVPVASLPELAKEILSLYGIDVMDARIYLIPARGGPNGENIYHNRSLHHKFEERGKPRAFVFKGVGLAHRKEYVQRSGLVIPFSKNDPPYAFRGGLLREETTAYIGAHWWLTDKFKEYMQNGDPIFEELKSQGLTNDAIDMFLEPTAVFKPLLLPASYRPMSERLDELTTESQDIWNRGLPTSIYSAFSKLLDAEAALRFIGLDDALIARRDVFLYQALVPDRIEELALIKDPTSGGRYGGTNWWVEPTAADYRWDDFFKYFGLQRGKTRDHSRLLKEMALRALALIRILWNEGYSATSKYGSMVSVQNLNPVSSFDYDTIGGGSKRERATDIDALLTNLKVTAQALGVSLTFAEIDKNGILTGKTFSVEGLLKKMDPEAYAAYKKGEILDSPQAASSHDSEAMAFALRLPSPERFMGEVPDPRRKIEKQPIAAIPLPINKTKAGAYVPLDQSAVSSPLQPQQPASASSPVVLTTEQDQSNSSPITLEGLIQKKNKNLGEAEINAAFEFLKQSDILPDKKAFLLNQITNSVWVGASLTPVQQEEFITALAESDPRNRNIQEAWFVFRQDISTHRIRRDSLAISQPQLDLIIATLALDKRELDLETRRYIIEILYTIPKKPNCALTQLQVMVLVENLKYFKGDFGIEYNLALGIIRLGLPKDSTSALNETELANEIINTLSGGVLSLAVSEILLCRPSLSAVIAESIVNMDSADVHNLIRGFGRAIQLMGASVDRDSVMRLARVKNIQLKREVFAGIIEPLFFKNSALFRENKDIIETFLDNYLQDVPEVKYLLFEANMHNSELVAGLPADLFPLHSEFRQIIARSNKRILVMHNMADGQGDELVRLAIIIQALLEFDQDIRIVVYGNNDYLPDNDRITYLPITAFKAPGEDPAMIIHYFSEDQGYDGDIEEAFRDYLERKHYADKDDPNHIYLSNNKDDDYFVFGDMRVGTHGLVFSGKKFDHSDNVYFNAHRVCAELGLPFRHGAQQLRGSMFTRAHTVEEARVQSSENRGIREAVNYWEQYVLPMRGGRQVVVFNGAGGDNASKGFTEHGYGSPDTSKDGFKRVIRSLIGNEFTVIVFTNNNLGPAQVERWLAELDKELGGNLTTKDRVIVVDPPSKERAHLYKYLIDWSDATVTVEGGVMHLTYAIGKPFIAFRMSGSGQLEHWMPLGADSRQIIFDIEDGLDKLGPILTDLLAAKGSASSPAAAASSPADVQEQAIYNLIKHLDKYRDDTERRLQHAREMLTRHQGTNFATALDFAGSVNKHTAILSQIDEIKTKIASVTNLIAAIDILRPYTSRLTPDQEVALDIVHRVVPGFDKRTVLFVGDRSLLADAFGLHEKDIGWFAPLAWDKNEWIGVTIVRSETSDKLQILSVLFHEHSHAQSFIPTRLEIGRFFNEGIAEYFRENYLREASNDPEVKQVMKGIKVPVLSNIFSFLDIDPLEYLIQSVTFYSYELEVVKALVAEFGEDFIRKVFTAGDLSLLRDKLGKRFNFASQLLKYNSELRKYNAVLDGMARYGAGVILRNPKVTQATLRAFRNALAMLREAFSEWIKTNDPNDLIDLPPATLSPRIARSEAIRYAIENFANGKITNEQLRRSLKKELANIIDQIRTGSIPDEDEASSPILTYNQQPASVSPVVRPNQSAGSLTISDEARKLAREKKAASSPAQPSQFAGEGWSVSELNLPTPNGSLAEDATNMTETFNTQFGSSRVVVDSQPLSDKEGLAELQGEDGTSNWHVKLHKQGQEKPYPLQVRLIGHEIQHAWNHDHLDLLPLLPQLQEFQQLQERFGKHYDILIQQKVELRGATKEHYTNPDEILARLRAYQIYLQQKESENAGAVEPHEFFDILTQGDLRWLDIEYLRRETKGLTVPALPEKPTIIISEDETSGITSDAASSPAADNENRKPNAAENPTLNTKGGIDFRGLPIVVQPKAPVLGTVPLGTPPRDLTGTVPVDLNAEWQQIENMLKAGIIPSSERIKEYLQGCYQNEDMDKEIDKVLACIADILRLEEERCQITESGLKEILVLLESDKPVKDMQRALINITILPKEPAIKP